VSRGRTIARKSMMADPKEIDEVWREVEGQRQLKLTAPKKFDPQDNDSALQWTIKVKKMGEDDDNMMMLCNELWGADLFSNCTSVSAVEFGDSESEEGDAEGTCDSAVVEPLNEESTEQVGDAQHEASLDKLAPLQQAEETFVDHCAFKQMVVGSKEGVLKCTEDALKTREAFVDKQLSDGNRGKIVTSGSEARDVETSTYAGSVVGLQFGRVQLTLYIDCTGSLRFVFCDFWFTYARKKKKRRRAGRLFSLRWSATVASSPLRTCSA
jgi:hypothetical protein